MSQKEKNIRLVRIIAYYVLLTAYFVSLFFLFKHQAMWTESDGSYFESDLPFHISMVMEDGWFYSLTALIYKLLFSFANGEIAIAVFLALCAVATIVVTEYLIRLIDNNQRDAYFYKFFAFAVNMVMPCYVQFKGISYGRYIGLQSASIWHNSTYTVMKLCGVICFIFYIKICRELDKGITVSNWLAFCVSLIICTAVKPSFLVVFAPMMAIYLLVALLKGEKFIKLFLFGCAVLPSLVVILLQNFVLFGNDTGNGWVINPGYTVGLRSAHPIIAAIISILFPIVMLGFFVLEKVENRAKQGKEQCFVKEAYTMACIGYMELFFLCETGSRATDANFMWGYSFSILIIFIVAGLKWFDGIQSTKKLFKKVYLTGAGLVFLYHLYCGLYFYLNLLQGISYFMR